MTEYTLSHDVNRQLPSPELGDKDPGPTTLLKTDSTGTYY